ncbi:FG-GAP-like repeat-containing protein [Streptomyces sp. NPDC090022]|uniref:FG-GAP-like repeat-containing protein n=1 Tax=Streptomyces sp. NPDC090022 TaxID=3365920 RepID=UPI00380CA37D
MRPPLARLRATAPPPRWRASALVTSLALTAGLIGTAPVALAAGPSGNTPGKEAASPANEAIKASAEAKRTGKPVEVVGQRTEMEEVWANPDGTMTAERALVPVRVRRGGSLIPVDTTLEKAKNGTLSPKATDIGLAFSGGGDAPLAVMSKNGRNVSLSWPKPLPAPVVEGNSALYREVLPGVDLRVTAQVDSFAHALVVKTREAAANPALARLDFGLKAQGLDIRAEADGQLRAVDPAGQTVFGSAKPQMWDASGEKAQAAKDPAAKAPAASAPASKAPAASAPAGKSLRSAPSDTAAAEAPAAAPAPAAPAPAAPAPAAPVDGITDGTKQADLGVKLAGEKLTLTPDKSLLTAPDTTYPVVIDPTWDAWKTAWTIAYKHNAFPSSAGTNYWNGGTLSKDARVGCAKDASNGNQVVCAKTFFQVGMKEYWDKQILESTLRIKQKSAGSWSCKSGDIQVWDTGTISKSTTWNNQPGWARMVDATGQSYGGRNCPGDGDLIELNVKSAVADAAKKHWGTWTFGLKAAKDTVDVSWRKLDPNSARISIKFNTPPPAPKDRSTDPSVPCTGGVIGTTDYVVLRARVTDKEDTTLHAEFHYWKDGAAPVKTEVKAANGNIAELRIPAGNLDGTYKWDVRTSDKIAAPGPWAGQCQFTMDRTRPDQRPTVSSPVFLESVDDPAKMAVAGTTGKFVFGANTVKDVTGYRWWTDTDPKVNEVPTTAPGGSVEVSYKANTTGAQRLFVRSFDASGNQSEIKEYLFYTKRRPTRDKPGDLNGDGHVDMWSVDPGSGKLWMHPGKGDGGFDVSRRLDDSDSFANVTSMTHRGSWNEDFYEDLVTLRPAFDDAERRKLYVYPNRGDGSLLDDQSDRLELMVGNPEIDDHWSQADQVLSIGSVNNDDDKPEITDADHPDLLVKSGDQLWLYLGSPVGYLDAINEPILLGNADWKNMTLLAPGDLNGDSLPEIWARDTVSGKIHQYTSRKTTDATSPTVADLTVYADPAARATAIGTGFTGAAYPNLTTNGDFEADGFADLYARDGDGRITEFPGRAPVAGSAFGAGRQLVLGGTSWSECQEFPSAAAANKKHSVCGPILAKFLAKGGTALGKPSSDIQVTSDGVGRFVHLRGEGQTSDNGSIYWHPSSGAWVVWGGIRAKWMALGAEKGIIGYPTSDETATFDGVGRFSTFYSPVGGKGGIYWSPETSAWSVHGGVYDKYTALGGPASYLGYPVTDETNVADNVGRFNHFRKRSDAAATGSIYWTKAKGAWSVFGSIRKKWIELGGEKSALGYPVSDEYEVAGGPREDFQNGYIRHNRTTGSTVEHKAADRTAHLRTDLSGDFNGDGRADLATVYDYGADTTALWVLDARPDGGFEEPTARWTSGKGSFAYSRSKWVTGDFNGDGRDDIGAVFGYADGSNALWSFLSNANGTFTPVKGLTAAVGNFDWSKGIFLAGDFNGDKRSDIAMVYDYGNGSAGTHTWTSKPDGTFNSAVASWKVAAGNWWIFNASFRAGDTNGDGRDDILALYGYSAGGVAMFTFQGQAGGGFAAPVKSWTQTKEQWEYPRTKFTIGDYNGDGRADAALMYDHGNGQASLSTLLAKPDGTVGDAVRSWETPDENWYASNAGYPVSGDADGDGRDDVLSMYNYASGATGAFTFKGRPDGGFENGFLSWQTLPGTW